MVCGICGVCFWTLLLLSGLTFHGYSYALRFVSLFPSRVCDSCFYSWCAIRHWTFGSHIFYLLVMILGFGLCKFLKSLSSSSSSVSVCVLLCVSFFSDLLLRSVSVPWIIFYPFTLKVRFLLLFLSVLPRLHWMVSLVSHSSPVCHTRSIFSVFDVLSSLYSLSYHLHVNSQVLLI